MPEVSIVINLYNSEKYLAKAIESVIAQTYDDWELILVNDGSTDSSLSICQEYAAKDSRIRVVDKPNGGLADARNAGLEAARGKYIQFADGDDWLEPDLVEQCINKVRGTNADIVVFDICQYFVQTGKQEILSHPYSEEEVYRLYNHPEMITKMKNCAWNKFVRLSLYNDNGIRYPKGYNYEDLGTTYRLLSRAEKIAFVKKPLYNYLQDRPGNLTGLFNRSVYSVLDMMQVTIEDYKKQGIYEHYYEEIKYLGITNIMECLKKTRTCTETDLADAFINDCFAYLKKTWPEYPKCKYPVLREKYDRIYADERLLKLYLWWKRRGMKKEK